MSGRPLRSFVLIGSVQALGYTAVLGWHLLLARSVDADLYGLIAFAMAAVLVLQVMLGLGYPGALIRFIPILEAEGERGSALQARRRAAGISLGAGLGALALLIILQGRLPDTGSAGLRPVHWIAVFGSGLGAALTNIATGLFIGRRRPVLGAFIGGVLIPGLLILGTPLSLAAGWRDAGSLLRLVLLVHAGAGLLSAALIWSPWTSATAGARPPEFGRFARRALGIGLVAVGLSYMDRLMLGWLSGFDQVALYNIPARLARLLLILVYLFNPILGPHYSRHLSTGIRQKGLAAYRSASRIIALATLPIALAFILYGREILTLAAGEAYAGGATVLGLLTLGALAITLTGNNALLIQMGGREDSELRMSMVALGGNFLLNAVLIPRYGALGAAVATLASLLISSVGRSLIVWRRWRTLPGVLTSARLAASVAAFWVAQALAHSLDWPWRLAIGLTAYLLAYGLGALRLGLRELESSLDDAPRPPRLGIIVAPAFGMHRGREASHAFLAEAGWEITAIAPPGEADHRIARALGLETHVLPMSRSASPLRDLISLIRLTALLLGLPLDLVQVSTPKAGLLGLLACRLAGHRRVVYLVRGRAYENFRGPRRRFYATLDGLACRLATVVRPVSTALARALVVEGICPARKIRVLGRGGSEGVDVGAFAPGRWTDEAAALRRELGLSATDRLLLFAGWIRREKGAGDLIEAFGSLASARPGLHLALMGDFHAGDPLEDRHRRAIEAHPRIHFLGWREDTAAVYAACDIHVLPSHREGMPRVVLEASASSRPSVVADWPGAEEIVEEGLTGRIVPRRNPGELAEALDDLLFCEERRVNMGRAAFEKVAREFVPERLRSLQLAMYEELTGRSDKVENVEEGPLRALSLEDLDRLARLHQAAFPGYFLSRMGRPFLRAYFRLILDWPGGILLGLHRDGRLVGYTSGFEDPSGFYAHMRRRRIRMGLLTLGGLLRDPRLLARTLWNIRSMRERAHLGRDIGPGDFELSSLAVHPAESGKGVGSLLTEALFEQARQSGGSRVIALTDETENDGARAFYRKVGMVEARSLDAGGGRRMIRMEFDLRKPIA